MINVLETLGSAMLWGIGLLTVIISSILYTYFTFEIYRYFKRKWKIKKEIKKKNNKE